MPLQLDRTVNEVWSMDFVGDSLSGGRRLKYFTVADDFTHDSVDIVVDFGISGQYVTRVLDRAAWFRGYSRAVRTDNRPEFTSRVFMAWAQAHGIRHILIQPGRPMQNGYIGSFNGKFRDEQGAVFDFAPIINKLLQAHLFGDIFECDNLDWQSRELATVGALAATPGAEAQLRSHMRARLLVGLTAARLQQLAQALADEVGTEAAVRANEALTQTLGLSSGAEVGVNMATGPARATTDLIAERVW